MEDKKSESNNSNLSSVEQDDLVTDLGRTGRSILSTLIELQEIKQE